jgi:predicted transcriptional regulator
MYNIDEPKQLRNKRGLRRIDWSTVKKIMIALSRDNKMKKTNLAMACGISYDNCISYLRWLELLGLIKTEIGENGSALFGLNSRGMDLCKKEFENDQEILN